MLKHQPNQRRNQLNHQNNRNCSSIRDEEQMIDVDETKVVDESTIVDGKKKIIRKIKKPEQQEESLEKPVETTDTTEIVPESRDEEQMIDVDETKIVDESIIVDGKKKIRRKIKNLINQTNPLVQSMLQLQQNQRRNQLNHQKRQKLFQNPRRRTNDRC
ncbi:hypothetical protein BLOT_003452 [Blomia tropicalis]|nr:hypothetical protein BLOT_003452 [Blomia tropicalis]